MSFPSTYIHEPEENTKNKLPEVYGKGKGRAEEINHGNYMTQSDHQITNKVNEKKKRKNNRRKHTGAIDDQGSKLFYKQSTNTEKGQTSCIKKGPTINNKAQDKNISTQQPNTDTKTTNQKDTNLNSKAQDRNQITIQSKTSETYPIDPGDAQHNYLKLISGTSLEEDQESDEIFISKQGHQSESSSEEEEEDSSEDQDYEEEMSTEVSDDYVSVDSESFNGEDLSDNHDNMNLSSDEHADILTGSFCSQALVDVNVTSEFAKIIDKTHISPRGRGRGRNNNRGGRQNARERGGRITTQQPVSINSNGTFDRLKQIIRLQHPPFIAISEPFYKADQIDKFKRLLGFTNAYANCNSQIWLFWNDIIDCSVVEETDQQDSLRDVAANYNLPWYIAGDFNYITDPAEKQGGTPHRMSKSLSFLQCIMECDLVDPGYSGSNFIWCNGWSPDKRVWQRLDRVLVNHEWMNLFDSTSVDHLIRTGSDHSLLLTIALTNQRNHTKYFRFLDLWTEEENFYKTVENAWNSEVQGSAINSVGNIFDQVTDLEKNVDDIESRILIDNSEILNDYDNDRLTANPTVDELKDVVYSMSSHSAPGPDGISGKFYHSCWEIIKDDLVLMVLDFFAVKILSKLVNQRLSCLMHFIKGISITDNIMLTQEMVHNINRTSTHGNVVLKLDMTKAYDRVTWDYLCRILRQFRFFERWIDSVWRLITNVWYSVNINGTRHGFFSSTRSIKQGDPLSPFLFIIGAKLFSKMMDSLTQSNFIPFSMDKNDPNISHLCYADDTILFSSCDPQSLELLMNKLGKYEEVFGQLINKRKSGFYVTFKEDDPRINIIKGITGFNHCQFPMIYLGCPIYVGRKIIIYFNTMVTKVAKRLQGWQGKLVSYGGKAVLIKSVLQDLPLYLLSVVYPPKTAL
ncbi:uncharacterized protein LOC132639246 [Lycium barbarum]|uniref:uncharacterized protein LOC132639246 n=1 Tax=Lycium barbarum TaxID=112863 RepID=UPI00293EF5ED|nr:uncharacterized protein LOC132639246 [Lycium barbarum]